MNNADKEKLFRLAFWGFFFVLLFNEALPFVAIVLAIYLLYKKSKGQNPIPPSLGKHLPEDWYLKINNYFGAKSAREENIMETIRPKSVKKFKGVVFLAIVLIVILPFVGSFFTIIDAGETGVRSFFGKVRDKEFSSGFHLKNPLERVTKMNIRTQEYTMSIAHSEGKRVGDDSIAALTKEGLQVDLDITVLFSLVENKASDVYKEVGLSYEDVIIRPQIRSTIREVIAEYQAKDIYSEKRQEAAQKILEKLKKSVDPRGVEVEDVLLRNVQLPSGLAESIQEKLQAEQDAERYNFVLEKEAKEAERKRIEAEGQRDAQQIINQSLTPRYLEFLYINSLKDREGTIYVPTNSNNGLPLFRGI